MRDGDEFHEEFNLHDGDRINLIQLFKTAAMEEGSWRRNYSSGSIFHSLSWTGAQFSYLSIIW